MTTINSSEETATVTVVTVIGTAHQWEAGAIEIDEGALIVGAGEKDGVAEVYAVYAKGQWQQAGMDGHRAGAGPDRGPGAAYLAALEKIAGIVTSAAGSNEQKIADVWAVTRDTLGREPLPAR